jgi:Na+-translocating ferredoxin:NAD+ oxidoreductase RnfG subunit
VKSKFITIFAVLFSLTAIFSTSHAARLLTQEQALKQMFPDVDEVKTETKTLTPQEIIKLKAKLGGNLFHFTESSSKEKVKSENTYTVFYGIKNKNTVRIAIIDEQPGKWGPVEFILAIDTATSKINNLAVMSYKEQRGRPIARVNFLKQFFGKGSVDPVAIRKDIRAISGATVSSDCACFAVKKAIVMYEEVLKK